LKLVTRPDLILISVQNGIEYIFADFPNVVAAGRCYAHAVSDAMFRQPARLRLRFGLCIATEQNTTFWELCTPARGHDPQIWTRPRFLYNAPTPKFHHPIMFTRLEVIVLTNTHTNKQTHAAKNIQRSSLRHGVG